MGNCYALLQLLFFCKIIPALVRCVTFTQTMQLNALIRAHHDLTNENNVWSAIVSTFLMFLSKVSLLHATLPHLLPVLLSILTDLHNILGSIISALDTTTQLPNWHEKSLSLAEFFFAY